MIYGVDPENGYRPLPIPPRGARPQNPVPRSSPPAPDSTHEPFVELDITGGRSEALADAGAYSDAEALADAETGPGTFPCPPQPLGCNQALERDADKMRALFSDMRQIARQGSWYHLGREEIFYRQAKLMEDFTDDYHAEVEFTRYFPRYSKMDSAQLRTYFTWRTKVRNGRVCETSVSYAFLYIYELLNGIGVTDPEDGLEKLVGFWSEFRSFDPLIDRYLLPWLKDYHVVYPLSKSFRTFAEENLLQEHYPLVFCFTSGKADSFALFSSISSYDIKKSKFYSEETAPLIHECFYFVLTCLREAFRKKRKRFEDQVLYIMKRKSKWIPFAKALYYPAHEQHDRIVSLSVCEVYECKNRSWSAKTVMPSDHGSQVIGYIMKETEAYLRAATKFPYKLSADLDSCKAVDRGEFEKLGISIPDIVKEGCAAFYRLHTRRTVSVDPGNLEQIRKDAFETQEKLLIPEKEAAGSSPLPDPQPDAMPSSDGEGPLQGTSGPTDSWAAFHAGLTEVESDALRIVLDGGPLKEFALLHNIMLEVLIDGINRKAMDCIGDAVLEIDDTVFVFDDYRKDLMEAVNR